MKPGLFALIVALLLLASVSMAVDRPNILFILADDQRPDTIGAYGNAHIQTPNIDSIVRQGFSFRRNYCMGSMHGAVCQPSRAMMMSGRSLYHTPMDLVDTPILPELLRAAGYTTFMTGKWHNGGSAVLRGFEKGKAILLGGMSNHEAVPVQDVSAEGTFTNKRTGEKFSSELFADAAVEFLGEHDGETPFFAYVAFTAPHDPRQPPLAYRTPYYDKLPPLPPNFMPQHPFDNGWLIGRDENLAAWPRTESVVRDQLAEYYGMITHMDEQIGRILGMLEEKGFAENTVVVYAADHGLAVGSHGLLGKQNLYEHSMGAPLVFMGPGIPREQESQSLTYLMDIMPTLCGVAGIKAPAEVEGITLQPIWEGKQEAVRDTLYLTYEDSQRSVQDGRWKLIRYPKIGYMQLFDLEKDVSELENLAGLPEYSDKVAALLVELERWQKRVGDTVALGEGKAAPEPIDLSGHPREPDNSQPDWVVKKYFGDFSGH